MTTKSVINLFQTQPKTVQDLTTAMRILGCNPGDPQVIRKFLYPAANDSRDRWNEYLDACESLGFISRQPFSLIVTDELDEASFGRYLRKRFAQEESDGATNALVYIAYRAALEVGPDQDGGTATKEIMDRAEERASQILGVTSQRRYDQDKMQRWRWWITAAGLGFPGPRTGIYVICPVVALRDEILSGTRGGTACTLREFLASFTDIPLVPGSTESVSQIPIGTGEALRILEDRALIKLIHTADARGGVWHIGGRSSAVTHVEVLA